MSAVSQDLAKKALQVEAANVLKKLNAGKTLTTSERALIQSIASGEDPEKSKGWAKTKVELCSALGISRMTLDRWLKLKRSKPPGHESDGRWNVVEWKSWMRETGRGGGIDGDDADEELPRLNAKRLILINERLQLDNEERRGELISRDEVVKECADIATALRSALYGCAASVCEEVMKLTDIDEAVRVFNGTMDRALQGLTNGLKTTRQKRRGPAVEEPAEQKPEEPAADGTHS